MTQNNTQIKRKLLVLLNNIRGLYGVLALLTLATPGDTGMCT